MNIAAHIRKEASEHGLSQVKLANKVGYTEVYMSQLLSGTRALTDEKVLKILIKGFNYSPEKAREILSNWRIEEYKKDIDGEAYVEQNIVKLPILHKLVESNPESNNTLDFPASMLMERYSYYIYEAGGILGHKDTVQVLVRITNEYQGAKPHVYKLNGKLNVAYVSRTQTGWNIVGYPPISDEEFEIVGVVDFILEKF